MKRQLRVIVGSLAACGVTVALVFAAADGSSPAADTPVTIAAGPDWVPLEVRLDIVPGSALDFTDLVPRDAPAGKFGRVVVNEQGKFAFERRNTPSRFYGVDLCCTAQYLPHELADRLAERLVRLGYNTVRIHHYERDLVDRTPGTIRLKPDKLDQLDYLVWALKRRGVYVTTDLYVSRLIPRADVYPAPFRNAGESQAKASASPTAWTFENYYNVGPADFGVQDFKMAVYVNDRAYENYKAFARALLDHRNPYTKLRWADDPAVAWLSLMNEDCPGNFIFGLQGKLREDWQRAWNRWLTRRHPDHRRLADGQDPVQGAVSLPGVRAPGPDLVLLNIFLADVQLSFVQRTRAFLRDEMRCAALLSDCNGWTNPVQLQAVRSRLDYVDDHFYVDHPTYLAPLRVPPTRSDNANPIAGGASGGRACAFSRIFGKPLTITEFNYCGPGQYRGVGGIVTGALAALQDWDGLWRHVYSYSSENITRPAAMYFFDVAADPLTQAAERAGLCLFLRGDAQPAKHSVAITSAAGALLEPGKTQRDRAPAWSRLAWLTRVGWRIDDEPRTTDHELRLAYSGGDPNPLASAVEKTIFDTFVQRGWLPASNRTDLKRNRIQSENGEVTVDASEGTFTVDTPCTAGGFAPAGKRIHTRAATIEVLDTYATVWVSSLDGKPIDRSRRLLITHLTDLQNSGTRFSDRTRRLLLAWGELPHLVRVGRATVALRLERAESAKVYGLAVDGKRTGEVPASATGGTLSVPLSVSDAGKARIMYEIDSRRK